MSTELQTITSAKDIIFQPDMMSQVERIANIMASSGVTVPKHLQGNKGDCFAIALQSMQWGMNPFSVSQKTHLVNGVLGYEAQLVNAVITSMAPTTGRLEFEWFGDWSKVIGNVKEVPSKNGGTYRKLASTIADEKGCGVKVWATLQGESKPRVLDLLLIQASVRNSTLWADDPKQQLAYLAIKRWSRLYCPDVIMGVYTRDELEEIQVEKEINPQQPEQTVYIAPLEIDLNDVLYAITTSDTIDELNNVAKSASKLTADEQKTARRAYSARKKELTPVKAEDIPESEAEIDWLDAISNCKDNNTFQGVLKQMPKDAQKQFADVIEQKSFELGL